jgi:hypothetical protein
LDAGGNPRGRVKAHGKRRGTLVVLDEHVSYGVVDERRPLLLEVRQKGAETSQRPGAGWVELQ